MLRGFLYLYSTHPGVNLANKIRAEYAQDEFWHKVMDLSKGHV